MTISIPVLFALSDAAYVALFGAAPNILIAIAILWGVIRGNMSIAHLKEIVDGKFSEMLTAVKETSEVKGKTEVLTKIAEAAASPAKVEIVGDRRTTSETKESK